MKLKHSPKNPRVITDEYGNYLFTFEGLHLSDLRQIVKRHNRLDDHHYSSEI